MLGKLEKTNSSRYAVSASLCKAPQYVSYHCNEQVSDSSPLEWIYCNRTATGLIRTGTQWTKDWLRITENRLNKPISGHTSTG